MRTRLLLVSLLLSLFCAQSRAQSGGRMAILPFTTLGIDQASALTAQSLLRQEMEKLHGSQFIPEKATLEAAGEQGCFDKECAAELGRKLDADRVLLCSLNRLGEKVIVQYSVVDVKQGQYLLNDNTTSTSLEDLETVMKRVALCATTLRPFSETGQIGLITQKETLEPRRKAARKYMGLSFGYLYPQQGFDDEQRTFAADFRTGYEMNQFTVGSQIAVQHGFGWNIYTSYLFTDTDICPYLGGAAGFHWVSHETYPRIMPQNGSYYSVEDNREGDGFEVRLHTGLRLFRTYNFQVLLNMDYSITFNDYDDRAIIFTIGLLR